MEAAALAAQQNVKVYTIGISRNLGTTSARGGEVDEALLRAIAEATGGEYFRARDPRELQASTASSTSWSPSNRTPAHSGRVVRLGIGPC